MSTIHCIHCDSMYTKNYYSKHLKTKKHQQNITKEKKSEIVVEKILPYTVYDIRYFYETSQKKDNDRINKLRELILVDIINDNIPKHYFNDIKWRQLKINFQETIYKLCDQKFDEVTLTQMAGRLHNYDFIATFYKNSRQIYSEKIEFKYTTNIFNYPQFLSLYITSIKNNFINDNFIELWYNKYLDDFLAIASECSNNPHLLHKPTIRIYTRMINDTNGKTPFMKELKYVLKNMDRHCKMLSDRIVNSAISDYINTTTNTIQLDKLQDLFNHQQDKVFICCQKGVFTANSISKYLNLSNTSISHNHNTIIIKNKQFNTNIKILLRWKNDKGRAGPAWQIGINKQK